MKVRDDITVPEPVPGNVILEREDVPVPVEDRVPPLEHLFPNRNVKSPALSGMTSFIEALHVIGKMSVPLGKLLLFP